MHPPGTRERALTDERPELDAERMRGARHADVLDHLRDLRTDGERGDELAGPVRGHRVDSPETIRAAWGAYKSRRPREAGNASLSPLRPNRPATTRALSPMPAWPGHRPSPWRRFGPSSGSSPPSPWRPRTRAARSARGAHRRSA